VKRSVLTQDIGEWNEKLSLNPRAKVLTRCHSKGGGVSIRVSDGRGIEYLTSLFRLADWVMKLVGVVRDGRLSRCDLGGYLPESGFSCTVVPVLAAPWCN